MAKRKRKTNPVVVIPNPSVARGVKSVLKKMGIKFGSSKVRRNVQGYEDSRGVFHPIRASADYDESRVAGRSKSRRPKNKSKSKAKSRRKR